jgi:two-component system phosphate regulon response regulator PhoB
VSGSEITLTATEFRLLAALAERPGRVLSRGMLLEEVWAMPPDLNTRTVDTHIKRLREKLGAAASSLETVRGVGYRFGAQRPE